MAKTKPIRDALRAVFYPHALSLGFEVDNRLQPQFNGFRRFTPTHVHVFQIQWDKYHRPRFVINFSEAPVDGIDFYGTWMEAKDIMPVHCGTYLRLARSGGRFTSGWFHIRRPLFKQLTTFKRNYAPEELAAEVVTAFADAEDWWANKVIGKHIRSF